MAIYSNGFRISTTGLEVQLSFKLLTPMWDENSNELTNTLVEEVADIRLNRDLATQLRDLLSQQLERQALPEEASNE